MTKKGYPSDSTDAEWAFVVPYLTLIEPYWVSWRLCSHAASLGMACA